MAIFKDEIQLIEKKQSEGEFQKKVIVICSIGTYSTTGMQGELLCYDILIGTPVN